MSRRVKAHLEHVLLTKKLQLDTNELLHELSPPLRSEVALHRCSSFMLHPKFVGILTGGADDEDDFTERRMFIKLLVTKMQLVVFSPGDFAIEEGDAGHEVFFLGQGTVAVIAGGTQVATLTDGACFGEIALLVPGALRTASIVALAFCETHVLPRSDFAACLSGFPEMHSRIRAIAERRVQELKQLSSAKKKTSRATSAAVSTLASAPAADGPAAVAAPPPRGAELLRRSSNFLSRKLSIGGAPRVQPGASRWRQSCSAQRAPPPQCSWTRLGGMRENGRRTVDEGRERDDANMPFVYTTGLYSPYPRRGHRC